MDKFFLKSTLAIAIPFYNAEKYFAQAIDSVLNQTFTNFELILIDDGSSDGSLEIAQDYAKKDNRIKVYSDGKNKNLAARLNEISSLTQAEYLARMDADDIMHPKKIEKQLDTLLRNPDIDVLGTNVYSIDDIGKVVGIRINPNQDKLIKVKQFVHPTIIAKTEWFLKNPYNVKAERMEDVELWMRTCDKNNFAILTEPLFYYREFGGCYYKKYLKGLPSLIQVLRFNNYNRRFIIFSIRYILSTFRSYIYFLFGKENDMIKKRNKIIY